MPTRYPPELRRQVIDLARSGTRIAQLASTFGICEATIYNWLKQERIDRGEIESSRLEWCSCSSVAYPGLSSASSSRSSCSFWWLRMRVIDSAER